MRGTLTTWPLPGADRSVSLCRELTKLHEEIKRRLSARPWPFIRTMTPAASMLVLAGTDPAAVEQAAAPTLKKPSPPPAPCKRAVPAAAAKQAAAGTPFSKGDVYRQLING